MSFLGDLTDFTKLVGRGAEDLFSLGGTEVWRKFGGDGAKNILDPLSTALGANFEAGAAGGSGMGLGSLFGAGGGGAGAGFGMNSAGSTLGGGMGSSLNLGMGDMAGAGGMSSYMPMSTPSMDMAGSTLGPGGMFSGLNPMGSTGLLDSSASSGSSAISKALNLMRQGSSLSKMMGGGQQQQQPQPQQNQQHLMQQLYQMFPQLKPGTPSQPLGQGGGQSWRL